MNLGLSLTGALTFEIAQGNRISDPRFCCTCGSCDAKVRLCDYYERFQSCILICNGGLNISHYILISSLSPALSLHLLLLRGHDDEENRCLLGIEPFKAMRGSRSNDERCWQERRAYQAFDLESFCHNNTSARFDYYYFLSHDVCVCLAFL